MLQKILAEVEPKKNKEYLRAFSQVIETSPLTVERTLEICDEKPIIGNVINGCMEYGTLLALERLEKLGQEEYSSLTLTHLNDLFGLDVGLKSSALDIIQEQYPSHFQENVLKDSKGLDLSYWVEIPEEFKRATHELLPSAYMKRKFRCLTEN